MPDVVPTLAVLLCPVSMGLMMVMMSRGSRSRRDAADAKPPSLEVLREEQHRLAAEIDRLERSRADV